MKDTKKLFALFEQYAHAQNYSTAFCNLLDHFLIAFKYYENEEEQAIALNKLAAYQDKELHIALLTEVGELAEGFNDPLGELYEQYISKGQNGQFFTPTPVAELMALITGIETLQSDQTVYDPACGSGRMLLLAAKINRHLRFYGADIDEICCKMALANMLLYSLTGEIAHMDTLANSFYRGYRTGTILKDGYHYPYYIEFTNPEESYIWLRPTVKSKDKRFDREVEPTRSPWMSQGVQGKLFE
ncbi:MAG: N-6 DNA methylase [Bacteroidetes bacterium]|jgi:type I restriction-modification system DNA methylase subunit|nr:N-6 DNA methylase [Bacteroidota bacterium]